MELLQTTMESITTFHVLIVKDPSFMQKSYKNAIQWEKLICASLSCSFQVISRYKVEGRESYQSVQVVEDDHSFLLVGLDKIAELQKSSQLATVDVANEYIYCLGECDSFITGIENLNLSCNCISRWNEFINILDSLPNLHMLRLNHNTIQPGLETPSRSSPIHVC